MAVTKALIFAAAAFFGLGWISSLATGTLLVDDQPLNISGVPNGQVHIASGLADYKGLSFFTPDGKLLRHSNYILTTTAELPNIQRPEVTALYDGTFLLEPVYSGDQIVTHHLRAVNLPFYRLASGTPPVVTNDANRFAKIAIQFDSPLGWYYMLAGRYRALVTTIIVLVGILVNFCQIKKFWEVFIPIATLGYAAIWWGAFQPGLFSGDSIHQLHNATSMHYDTMNPPFMAAIAHLFFSLGLTINSLITAQLIFGLAGIHAFIWHLTPTFGAQRKIASAIIFALILSPLFPFMPYLLTFWKDAWAGIAIVWAAAFMLCPQKPSDSKTAKFLGVFGFFIAALIFTLVRHNAILLAPLWSLAGFIYLKRSTYLNNFRSAVLSAIFGGVLLGSQSICAYLLNAERLEASNQIYLLELLGVQYNNPNFAINTPLVTSSIVDPQWRAHFDLSRNDQLFGWGTPQVVSPEIGKFHEPVPNLAKEYWNTWRIAPIELLKVKFRTYYLLLTAPRSPYANGIATNDLGLAFAPQYSDLRNMLFWVTERTWNSSARILATPMTGLIATFLMMIVEIVKFKGTEATSMLSVIALSLGLYMVFFLACPSSEYRYLFPAMLLTCPLALARVLLILKPNRA